LGAEVELEALEVGKLEGLAARGEEVIMVLLPEGLGLADKEMMVE
jgi:hypothetical protein